MLFSAFFWPKMCFFFLLTKLEPFGTKSLDVGTTFPDIVWSILDRLKPFTDEVSIQNLEIKRDS